MTREPIINAAGLDALDDADVADGYHDGRAGEPEPGDNRSYSYWHGWWCGAVDGKHQRKPDWMAALAHDVIKTGWLTR